MPSNRQRRESAQRKLQRQLARRAAHSKARRRNAIVAAIVACVVVAGGIIYLVVHASRGKDTAANPPTHPSASTGQPASGESSNAPTSTSEPNPLGCVYTESGTAAKPVTAPTNRYPATEGTVDAVVKLNGTDITMKLDRAKAPCSVNAFLSLAEQKYYDGTSCHRLTHSDGLNVLQCGDPSGKGNGGPGFNYATETSTAHGADPIYTVGTVALANTAGLQGSQFFIVYGPMQIPTSYTVIGHVDEPGMTIIQDIAAKGVVDGLQDGKPVAPADIASITVPAQAAEATTSWTPTPTVSPTAAPGGGDTSAPAGASGASGASDAPVAEVTPTPRTTG